MKNRAAIACFSILLGACFAMPAFAQNAKTENTLRNIMIRHPELQNDPNLLNNPGYLDKHPNLKAFMEHHPGLERQIRDQYGAYDGGRVWRNQEWWHANNPQWMYEHHPEWAENHPTWRGDGDWDDAHRWHSRDWWYENHREWAEEHHPDWRTAWQERKERKNEWKAEKREEKAERKAEKHEHHHGHG